MAPKQVRVLVLTLLFVTAGCYRVRSQLIGTTMPPETLYRCVQLELGKAGYAIVGADRASGWLHAQKRINRLTGANRAEIYATVIPEQSGAGAHLQLTDNSYGERDADNIRSICTP